MRLDFNLKYNGTVNFTLNGLTCQRCDSQNPHKHQYTSPEMFPEETLEGVANYCRTPDCNDWRWCFTTSPEVRSQACDIDIKLCTDEMTPGTQLTVVIIAMKYATRQKGNCHVTIFLVHVTSSLFNEKSVAQFVSHPRNTVHPLKYVRSLRFAVLCV